MANNEFGFDPDDLDRFFPGAGDQLRGALGQFARMLNASARAAAQVRPSDSGAVGARHPSRRRPGRPARASG